MNWLIVIGLIPVIALLFTIGFTQVSDNQLIDEKAYAEQTVEGVKYKVLLSDGVGTQDNLD